MVGLASEEARLAANSILGLTVDPHRVVQPNCKYPAEAVPIFSCPRCRDILFRLPPGALVYRLNVWDDGNRVVYRLRTADGREGWTLSTSCVREEFGGRRDR